MLIKYLLSGNSCICIIKSIVFKWAKWSAIYSALRLKPLMWPLRNVWNWSIYRNDVCFESFFFVNLNLIVEYYTKYFRFKFRFPFLSSATLCNSAWFDCCSFCLSDYLSYALLESLYHFVWHNLHFGFLFACFGSIRSVNVDICYHVYW